MKPEIDLQIVRDAIWKILEAEGLISGQVRGRLKKEEEFAPDRELYRLLEASKTLIKASIILKDILKGRY